MSVFWSCGLGEWILFILSVEFIVNDLVNFSGGRKETVTSGHVTSGHSNKIFAVKFHPTDTNLLVSGGWDKTVQVRQTQRWLLFTIHNFPISIQLTHKSYFSDVGPSSSPLNPQYIRSLHLRWRTRLWRFGGYNTHRFIPQRRPTPSTVHPHPPYLPSY